jgi:hypothetical protein
MPATAGNCLSQCAHGINQSRAHISLLEYQSLSYFSFLAGITRTLRVPRRFDSINWQMISSRDGGLSARKPTALIGTTRSPATISSCYTTAHVVDGKRGLSWLLLLFVAAASVVVSYSPMESAIADLDASFLVSRLAHRYGPSAALLPVRFSLRNKDTSAAHPPTVVSHRSGLSFPFVSLHWTLFASVPAVPEDATLMHALEEFESVDRKTFLLAAQSEYPNAATAASAVTAAEQHVQRRQLAADCIPGKYVKDSDCATCDSGEYQPSTNEASCIACEAAKYQSSGGNSYCLPCLAGSITNTAASSGARNCTECGAGEYSTDSSAAE